MSPLARIGSLGGEDGGILVFVALLGAEGQQRLRDTPLFVPHRRVAQQAESAGLRKVLIAGPGDDEMIERLVAYFSDDRERSRP